MRFPLGHTLKKPFHFLLVFLGCLHMAGGPYAILQGYAWVNMLVSYSQQDGIVKAAKDTFSGEKPCKLCCKIAKAQESEPKEKDPAAPAPPLSGKLTQEMLPARVTFLAPPAGTDLPPVIFHGILVSAGSLRASPPVPPPCRLA